MIFLACVGAAMLGGGVILAVLWAYEEWSWGRWR